MKRTRRWFIEPLDAHTNEVLAKETDGERHIRRAEHGKCKKVYEVTLEQKVFFEKSVTQTHLDFKVWTALDEDPMRLWSKSKTKESAISQVRKMILARRKVLPNPAH